MSCAQVTPTPLDDELGYCGTYYTSLFPTHTHSHTQPFCTAHSGRWKSYCLLLLAQVADAMDNQVSHKDPCQKCALLSISRARERARIIYKTLSLVACRACCCCCRRMAQRVVCVCCMWHRWEGEKWIVVVVRCTFSVDRCSRARAPVFLWPLLGRDGMAAPPWIVNKGV